MLKGFGQGPEQRKPHIEFGKRPPSAESIPPAETPRQIEPEVLMRILRDKGNPELNGLLNALEATAAYQRVNGVHGDSKIIDDQITAINAMLQRLGQKSVTREDLIKN